MSVRRDALALSVDAVRLVFVDGEFRPELSDDTHSGFEIEKRRTPAPERPGSAGGVPASDRKPGAA
jgi:Fe-S cluster assembly protein SufD